MIYSRYLVAVFLAVSITSCSFETTYDPEVYWKCGPEGKCGEDCTCIEGRFCVPDNESISPGDCAWCPDNLADCNSQVPDGCETDLTSDSAHCGSCTTPCNQVIESTCLDATQRQYPTGVVNCVNSICDYVTEIEVCQHGCQGGECRGELCGEGRCDPDENCDNNVCYCGDNPGVVCPANEYCCEGICVDLQNDAWNCNACGKVCGDNAICAAGKCECDSEHRNCDTLWDNGCEIDVYNDPDNCGWCGEVCPDNSHCMAADCHCNQDFANCDEDWESNGCEADLNWDDDNCSACENSCGDEAFCSDGACSCKDGFQNCDGGWDNGCEVDVFIDDHNCGRCGNQCAGDLPCTDGQCGVEGVICGSLTCTGADTNICCYDIDETNYFCTDTDGCPGETNGLACDGPEDCPMNHVCCLNSQNGLLAECGPPPCEVHDLCSSDDQCLENDDGKPYCCSVEVNQYWILLCKEFACD